MQTFDKGQLGFTALVCKKLAEGRWVSEEDARLNLTADQSVQKCEKRFLYLLRQIETDDL